MKKAELKNLSEKQIETNLIELRKNLMKLNAQRASGTPTENPGKIRAIRRDIARLLTYSNKKAKEVKGK